MESIDVVVIGAGVSGLASAMELARAGKSVCVVERHPRPGMDTSTRNSGVLHAGIYYPAGTLKATLCVEGQRLMYEFCRKHSVPHARCGKLIVATREQEIAQLEALRQRGAANGVEGLELVDRGFIAAREPAIRAVAALFSPATGIVNPETLVHALQQQAEAADAVVLLSTRVVSARPQADGIVIGTEREDILADTVVNAAGLYADDVSRLLGGETFRIWACRGEYAELARAKRSLVNALVYPLPHPSGHGLGVHLTRTTGGEVLIGPTISYQERKDDYEDDRLRVEAFLPPTRELLPDVTIDDLRLASSGIRPKLHPPTDSFADFLIRRDTCNPRIIQVAGIDSPGLTACLAIGRMVREIVAAS